ncbi:MAG: flagellar protein FlgN [Clostridia bacterium]|nr:flagellar protein FlgN [Clostridia bacterium]
MFFDAVLKNLNNQILYFSRINELCEEEKQAIIEDDVERIAAIVEELREYHKKTVKEEEVRIALIKDSKEFAGKTDVALDDIIDICTDAKLKEQIVKAKEELVSVFEKQKALDDIIDQLLEVNLEYCDYMINAFSSEVTPNNFYAKDGSEIGSDRAAISILDSEV